MNITEFTSLLSIFIAFVGILLTILTILINVKHNKLSVKPILKIIPIDFEGKIEIYIQNAGTGPLIRKKIKCSLGTNVSPFLIDLMPKNENIAFSNFSKFEEFVLLPNNKETLILLNGDPNDEEFNNYQTEIRKSIIKNNN